MEERGPAYRFYDSTAPPPHRVLFWVLLSPSTCSIPSTKDSDAGRD